jgi:hypothetical protein
VSTRTVAVGHLVDEDRLAADTEVPVGADPSARERVRTYLMSAGAVRRDADTAWPFGRRLVTDQCFLVEFGDTDEPATLCLLTDTGHLLFDRGGPILENEYAAAFLGGYFEFHDGVYQLHAEPVGGIDALRAARDELAAVGLVDADGTGRGPFADAVSRLAEELDAAIVAEES